MEQCIGSVMDWNLLEMEAEHAGEYQSEAWCTTIHMQTSLICMTRFKKEAEDNSTKAYMHLTSLSASASVASSFQSFSEDTKMVCNLQRPDET